MLAKLLFCDGGDFERSLRRRQGAALALLAVGLVGLACYFLLVPNSSLPDFAQGFYLGAAGGISAGAMDVNVEVFVTGDGASSSSSKTRKAAEARC